MMKAKRIRLWLCAAGVAATITISYAACYGTIQDPQCVTAGSVYAQCTPQGCSQSTGLIATQSGYEIGQYNAYATDSGAYTSRTQAGIYNTCYVSGCKVWNNCTQRYEYSPINGCSCNALVTRWWPAFPDCH